MLTPAERRHQADRVRQRARYDLTRRRDGKRTTAGWENTPVAVAGRRRTVETLHREGLTQLAIAVRLGVTERTVGRHLAAVRAARREEDRC